MAQDNKEWRTPHRPGHCGTLRIHLTKPSIRVQQFAPLLTKASSIFQVSAYVLDLVRDTSNPDMELSTLPLGPSLGQRMVKGLSRCRDMPSFGWTMMSSVLRRVWHGQSLVSERFKCGTGTVWPRSGRRWEHHLRQKQTTPNLHRQSTSKSYHYFTLYRPH